MPETRGSIDEKLTRQVAHLARLALTDSEVTIFTQQIGEILNYVETLQAVDVAGVEPLTHPLALELGTAFREDVAERFGSSMLAQAPDVVENGFKVPQVL